MSPVVAATAAVLGLPPGVAGVLLGAAAILVVATAVRAGLLIWRPGGEARTRWRSLATWWTMLLLLVAVASLGRSAVVAVMAVVSLLLLRETLSLTGTRGWVVPGVLVVLAVYLWAWLDWRGLFFRAVPLLLLAAALGEGAWRAGVRDRPRPRTAALRGFAAAVLVAAVGPVHVVAVASGQANGGASWPVAWLVVLLLLTELNDIAQAWWGRALGRHAMAPVLSPRKTWEGLVGGLAVTVAAAALVIPPATGATAALRLPAGPPLPPWAWSAGLGLVLGLTGTAGDLSASALKRAAGVKDSGDLLPGHGGVLDRFDSLVLAAPVFFVLVQLLEGQLPGGAG